MTAFLESAVDRRPAISSTSLPRSTRSRTKRPFPEYARSCRVRSAARIAASSIWRRVSCEGDPGPISARAMPTFPRTPTSRLLKSWAMPPASRPRLSSFCVCSIRASILCRSASARFRSAISAWSAAFALASSSVRSRTRLSSWACDSRSSSSRRLRWKNSGTATPASRARHQCLAEAGFVRSK